MEFSISVNPGPLEVSVGQSIRSTIFKGQGPLKTDHVYLKGISGTTKTFDYPIDVLTADYFTFKIGEGFVDGEYEFYIKRESATKYIAKVEYIVKADIPQGTDFELNSGSTVYGLVSCDGVGVKDVAVTDGYEIVKTDKNGMYQFKSAKKDGYVYITVPSGYEVECEGVQAMFYKSTKKGANTVEQIDFTLYPSGDQTKHTVMFLGDMHLANKQKDISQFSTFTSELNSYIGAHTTDKVYAITLGDMTWDLYWYSNNFCFSQYLKQFNVVKNLPVFHTIGNHDHNMQTSIVGASEGWDAVDWDTAGKYRADMGPNYYSINIGKIHYIVVDNIYCTNTTGGSGDDRHYSDKVSSDNIAWIKKDLANVSKSTPIVLTMHASAYDQSGKASLDNLTELKNCFSGYSKVTFVTGHTHKMWNIEDGSNFEEFNSGAVCASWWWAGYYDSNLNLAQDGAFGGYRIMDINGTEMPSYFKSTAKDASLQFRSYDLNQVYMPESEIANIKDYGVYNSKSSDNKVLLNVWDFGPGWKVEVTENGKALSVSQVTTYDPLYIKVYIGGRYGAKYASSVSFGPAKTNHMFQVTASSATSTLEIKVTDDEGREYKETMERPKAFTVAQYK